MFGINHLRHFDLTNSCAPSVFRESAGDESGCVQQRPLVINVASLHANILDKDYDYYTIWVDTGIKELKFIQNDI